MEGFNRPDELKYYLNLTYNSVYCTPAFLRLPLANQQYLKQECLKHLEVINHLLAVFKSIKNPDFWNESSKFIFDYFAAEKFETRLEAEFKKAFEAKFIIGSLSARAQLRDIGRECFQEYVLKENCGYSELPIIYAKIEDIKKKFLTEIEQQTNTQMVLSTDKKSKTVNSRIVSRALSCPSKMEYLIALTLDEFKLALKTPHEDKCCALLMMSEKPTEETLRKMPIYFDLAYVYVKKNQHEKALYFADKNTLLIEPITLKNNAFQFFDDAFQFKESMHLLSQEALITITTLSGHCYDNKINLYFILLQLLVYRAEGAMWGVFGSESIVNRTCGLLRTSERQLSDRRDEECVITNKKLCAMTKVEISQLFRRLSFLYHSDKNLSFEWQSLISQKKDEATSKLNGFITFQEKLIVELGLWQEAQNTLENLSTFVPPWIMSLKNVMDYAVHYHRKLKIDAQAEKNQELQEKIVGLEKRVKQDKKEEEAMRQQKNEEYERKLEEMEKKSKQEHKEAKRKEKVMLEQLQAIQTKINVLEKNLKTEIESKFKSEKCENTTSKSSSTLIFLPKATESNQELEKNQDGVQQITRERHSKCVNNPF